MNENVNGIFGEWECVPIETFAPNPNEAIVCHFNFNDCNVGTMAHVLDMLDRTFPDNPIVMLPDMASLESCDKDMLKRFVNVIEDVMKNL